LFGWRGQSHLRQLFRTNFLGESLSLDIKREPKCAAYAKGGGGGKERVRATWGLVKGKKKERRASLTRSRVDENAMGRNLGREKKKG